MADLALELLSRPDDVELRLVIADRLQGAGDPRGELIAVQCALAAARDPGERARLREREKVLVRSGIPELDPDAIELEWRLGFVESATVLDRACELVPALLAHPAARLIEELAVAVPAEELVALGRLLEARPRPSLLRRITAGRPAPGRRWIEGAGDAWLAPLAGVAGDLEIRPVTHVSQAAYEAEIEDDTAEHRNELWILQIAPKIEGWSYWAELPVRPGCEDLLAEMHATLSSWAQCTLPYDRAERRVRVYHAGDRTYVGYPNLYRAIREIALFVEDVRFTISESYSSAVDEFTISDGELRFVRGFAEEDSRRAKRAYWCGRVAERPRDDELRRFVARLHADEAEYHLRYVERRAPGDPDPDGHRDGARIALDRALSFDDRDPETWQLRGRLCRAVGDLGEAERCFARAQELDIAPGASLDLALTAFAAGQDATARERIERVVAASPDHTGARLVAGLLAARAGAPEAGRAHAVAAVREIERRRAATITPLDEHQRVGMWRLLEPGFDELAQTGRFAELVDWYLAELAAQGRDDGALLRGAAAHLLSCADHFRIRVAHGRQPEEAARLAEQLYTAAAELDPLAGSVHYCHWLFDCRGASTEDWRDVRVRVRMRMRGRANLERALAINPDHLDALAGLGGLHHDLGEHERAIELLERYVAVFSAALPAGAPRGYQWGLHVNRLASSHYEHACRILYGVPPGANRPPGRPDEATLARVDEAADRGLAVLRPSGAGERKELAPSYMLKAIVAAFRAQHRDALAWADRALECDDESPHAWAARASSANNLGMLDEATTCAQLALELDDGYWHPHYVLACVEAKRGGDREEILRRLRRVLELWPEGRPEIAGEPDLAPLRDDPELRALVEG